MLCHVGQFVAPPKRLLRIEPDCLAKVMKAPSNAVPKAVAARLGYLGSSAFVSLRAMLAAARMRAWLQAPVADEALEVLRAPDGDDEALSVNPVAEWQSSSIVQGMADHFAAHSSLFEGVLQPTAMLQRMLYASFLGPTEDDIFYPVLEQRFHTLDKDFPDDHPDHHTTARVMISLIKETKKHIKPAGVQAWLRAAFNAWCTTGRLPSQVIECPFCKAVESDSLPHYSRCTVLYSICRRVCPALCNQGYDPRCIATFLGYGVNAMAMPLVFCWVDAVHHTVIAHKRCKISGDPTRKLIARIRVFQQRLCKSRVATRVITDSFRPAAAFDQAPNEEADE